MHLVNFQHWKSPLCLSQISPSFFHYSDYSTYYLTWYGLTPWWWILGPVAVMWPLGVARRPLIGRSVYSGHQVAGINRLWSRQWRCVAKPAILYAHFWPVQAHTDTDQQLSAATRRCNCFTIVSPFLPPTSSTIHCKMKSTVCCPIQWMWE